MFKVKEEKEMILTKEQMLEIENHSNQVIISELKLELLRHKKSLIDLQFEKEIKLCSESNINLKGKRKEYNNIIKEEFGIESESFGYDPITGEIKL